MPNYCQLTVIGHLTRDPEQKTIASGKTLATFGIAVNDYDKSAMFLDCTAWERTAESCVKFLRKGTAAMLVGRLRQENWTSPDGQKRSKHSMTVERLVLLGGGEPRAPQEGTDAPTSAAWPDSGADDNSVPF